MKNKLFFNLSQFQFDIEKFNFSLLLKEELEDFYDLSNIDEAFSFADLLISENNKINWDINEVNNEFYLVLDNLKQLKSQINKIILENNYLLRK